MKTKTILGSLAIGLMTTSFTALAEPPFGDEADVAFAKALWGTLQEHGLVGENRTMSAPYAGRHPHGAFLDTMDRQEFSVEDATGPVIVKRNYGGEDLSKEAVWNDPDQYLGAVTVMFKREGYDPDNHDWFWAKYLPDGSLDTNPEGRPLAGRVAKGMEQGCIACHATAPGDDMVFAHDRFQ
ncbi:hypothetical protein L861_17280 [Litchfieldella anticariensis FP35 = DSM 16096]|uniref:Cytochrome P460 domain-containing protein n=1 Tax=Litchfieldella anticariensis (strain DSM 16096 / CECT 5854 / CIP 108499 / LMG 22089 / FP35) TaxID=1121939 RepID=S2KMZ4_LITA3|nr:cytochrome P460 family protein [Halomonas anticariensis]EPC03295.1 hypothetical protein L861_17280 [Halomonas anticariensis FP35 = DSM 16096]